MADLVGHHGRGIAAGAAAYGHLAGWHTRLPRLWRFSLEAARAMVGERLDGLVGLIHDEATQAAVIARDMPVVNVATTSLGLTLPSVIVDHKAVGRMAAEHLASAGLKRFGYFGNLAIWSNEREAGFVEGLKAYVDGETPGPEVAVFEAGGEEPFNTERIDGWLAELSTPIGVFACNDEHAMALLDRLAARGMRVPEDVAVLGVDDDPLINRLVTPSLSSIAPNFETIGYEACRLLERLMDGEAAPAGPTRICPAGVSARRSTELLAVEDEAVRAAMRYIREHHAEPITVEDVLGAVPAARRTLERRFRKALGRTVLYEIHRVHVERARRLLAETNLSIAEVATASGFTNATQLGLVFRKFGQQTPGAYRRSVRPGG